MSKEIFMEPLFDVVSVVAQKDNTLLIVFENGEERRFDMKPLLEKKPFSKLKDSPLFMKAAIAHGTVVWPGGIDIAPETLWDKSEPVQAGIESKVSRIRDG
jgi:hypothetical protein